MNNNEINNNQNKNQEEKIEIIDLNDNNKQNNTSKINDSINKIINTKETNFSQEEVNKYKNTAILCYIPFLFIIPMVRNNHKISKYMHYHINQGLNLTILALISYLVPKMLASIFVVNNFVGTYTPGWVLLIKYICACILIVIAGIGLINTTNGKSKELPIIGRFRLIK